MPYLKFHTKDKKAVQLSGNKVEDFEKAIEKNGNIAHSSVAMKWVKAYFERRDLEVLLQKAGRKEISIDEDATLDQLDAAEEKVEETRKTYDGVCSGKIKAEAEDEDKKGNDVGDYDFYNVSTTINEVSEDMF